MQQLSFNFSFEDNYLTEDFLITKSNQNAADFVLNYKSNNISSPKIFGICGPESSGKTHLAHIWKRNFGASFLNPDTSENYNFVNYIKPENFYIIEDLDQIRHQENLLHIYNLIYEENCFLMITSKINLQNIKFTIPDLASRLKNIFYTIINQPDEELIKMLLIKNFSLKQLNVTENIINYLSKNIERNFSTINKIVKILEFYCFEEKREITLPLAAKALKTINPNLIL